MKSLSLIILVTLFFACNNSQPNAGQSNENTPTEKVEIKEPPSKTPKKEITTPIKFSKQFNRGNITFKVDCENHEVSTINVEIEGLSSKKFAAKYEVEAQLLDAYALDLNNDNFWELYLVTRPTGDSGNLKLMGITSYKDKSAGDIYIKDTDIIRKVDSDKVYVEKGKLFRSLINEKGEQVILTYGLTRGETGYTLKHILL